MSTRNVRPFVHLRVLSSYSLGHGLSAPGDVCRHARRIGFDAVALTDVGGTHGFVEFHRAAREVGIKPIYGTLLLLDWSAAPALSDPVQTLILLALDRTGLRNVCAAATLSATRRERREALAVSDLEGITGGVVAIAGFATPVEGPSPQHFLSALRDIFADRLFVEYRDDVIEERAAAQARALAAAADIGVAPVLVQDVRFVGPVRHQLIDLVASASERAYEHRVFSDPRIGDAHVDHGMRTVAEMSEGYDDAPEAHSNAALIAALVQPDLMEMLETREAPRHADMFDVAGERGRALRARVEAAFEERFAGRAADAEVRRRTLQDELDAVERAGLAGTMVHFADVIVRLRRAGVVVGPMTGLSLQSLCAYLLGLTTFDPYALDANFRPTFEPGATARILDVQTAPEFRPRVLGTLNRVFDGDGIGYVPSVEHVTPARALRIVSRRLGAVPTEVEEATKVAARHHGVTLRELSEDNRAFGKLYRRSAAFRDIVSHAAAIEGLPFGFARTKRSVIASPTPLRSCFSFTVDPETGDRFVQATRDSFPVGDIHRIDIATLQVLAAVGDAVETPSDDREAFGPIARTDLEGVYLLEGAPGRLAASFGIATFDDLVYFVALLRQRRTGMSLAERAATFRHAERAVPANEKVGDILAPTYGLVVFDDQLRDVTARLTNLDAASAAAMVARFRDHAPGNLAALRREFLALTVEAGISFEDATAWFTRILQQAGHVQRRQRVIAEALIVRSCLGFKTRDRSGFFARLLDAPIDADKRARYRAVLEQEKKWLPPSVRDSARGHVVEGGRVRAPLWTIDGVSRDASDAIIRMRASSRATTVEEFRFAASSFGITLDTIDALIRAGAFDSAAGKEKTGRGKPRPVVTSAAAGEQMSMALLGTSAGTVPEGSSPPNPPSAHKPPVENDGNTRHGFRVVPSLSEFYPHPRATPVELAGRIRNFRDFKTSSGTSVGFFELFDSSGSVRVFVPWERVARLGEPLSDGYRVIVQGKVRLRDGRKVCDALEIVVAEGENGHGETSPDNASKGDP